jgi:phosphatidylserine/phosphatidylglycerophosphate/cardiolipin synthase-like enzyme
MKKILLLLLCACLPCFAGDVDIGFSPNAGAEQLVLDTIASARQSIRMAAYSFTSPKVMHRLLDAKKRGVDIRIVVDEKGNRSKASQAAMNLIVNAGIPLRTTSRYKIHHDKYIIVDGETVETGSFNYSKSAAASNSENVIVIRNNPAIAEKYLKHWQSRWDEGIDWKSAY